jgi:quercetin dioxygenase-like cupin family protein
MAPTTLKLTASESVAVLDGPEGTLEAEARYGPAGKPPPKHFHPAQDEHFEVLEGSLRVRAGDEDRTLGPGDTIEIPAGTSHQMWNDGEVEARVRWRTTPPGRTEQWWRELDELQRSGKVDSNGMPSLLPMSVLITEYDDVVRLGGPQPVVRGVLAGLAAIGRARGHRPEAGASAEPRS